MRNLFLRGQIMLLILEILNVFIRLIPPWRDRLPPLKVRNLRLDLGKNS